MLTIKLSSRTTVPSLHRQPLLSEKTLWASAPRTCWILFHCLARRRPIRTCARADYLNTVLRLWCDKTRRATCIVTMLTKSRDQLRVRISRAVDYPAVAWHTHRLITPNSPTQVRIRTISMEVLCESMGRHSIVHQLQRSKRGAKVVSHQT